MEKRNGTKWRRTALITVALICFAAGHVAAAEGVKAMGTLSEVRENGTVVIDDHGYELSPSAVIVDGQGKRVSLGELGLPTVVRYEYRFRENSGPAIKAIREMPQ